MYVLDALEDVVRDCPGQGRGVGLEAKAPLAQLQEHFAPNAAERVEAHVEELHVVALEMLHLEGGEAARLFYLFPPE